MSECTSLWYREFDIDKESTGVSLEVQRRFTVKFDGKW